MTTISETETPAGPAGGAGTGPAADTAAGTAAGPGGAPRPRSAKAEALIAQTDAHTAHNYHPQPVVVAEADGA
ncbi:MAG: hypothetical protein HOV83_31465, partial [Catenulispora sp.]|nr:hypothetical protein [Catenulispora sp.]